MNSAWKENIRQLSLVGMIFEYSIGAVLRYFLGNFYQSSNGKKNAPFLSYNQNFKEEGDFEITKLNKKMTLYNDRLNEVKKFFNKNTISMLTHFVANGTPNTNYYRYRLKKFFDDSKLDKNRLKQSYEKAAFMYANRLMLRYHNYKLGRQILAICKRLRLPKSRIRVLDYGCGVADPSLYLALHGVDVTIVDLDDNKFHFAISRFENRQLNVNYIGANDTEKPVSLGSNKYDFIIMAEFLEHVRNPRLFLEFAVEHLDDKHGILYDSLGPSHNHGIGGDHLKEAKEVMECSDYSSFFKKTLRPLNDILKTDEFKHFYFIQTNRSLII